MFIAGIDEAGRGPVMGPLVVGGVAVEDPSELEELGLKDSKKLTPRQRGRISGKIHDHSFFSGIFFAVNRFVC